VRERGREGREGGRWVERGSNEIRYAYLVSNLAIFIDSLHQFKESPLLFC
jgi:hypothetical protein